MVSTQVLIRIDEVGADAERLDELSRGLRAELSGLDVDGVAAVPDGPPPPGSRAADPAAVGALLVSIAGAAEVLRRIVDTVRAWCGRGAGARTAEFTIGTASLRLGSVSADQQDRLIEEFFRAAARESVATREAG